MFHAARWAGAFLEVTGEDAQEALLCLRAFVPPLKSLYGVSSGIEKILRESCADEASSPVVEYVIRFICLLTEKKRFKHIDMLLTKIESILNKKNGILTFTLETAVPVDGGFETELAQSIKKRTGAADVRLKTCVRPELLGGCLLRTDGFYIDASLKLQVEKLKTELSHSLDAGR